jgi:hypothetical protein
VAESFPPSSPHEAGAIAAADRVVGETRLKWALRLAGRIAGRALGLILLVAGLLKGLAPQTFAQEIADYGIVTNGVAVAMLAYLLVVVECALGAALLVNLKPRVTLALTSLLLLLFLGVVGYAWATGATENCGCFGPWKRTPGQAFVEDLVLLALAGWAWWGRWPAPAPTNTAKLAVVGFAVAAGAMVPAFAAFGGMAAPGEAGKVGSEAFRTIRVEDLQTDLSKGDHLVLLMSTDCPHCRDSVPAVNALAADARLPKVVAIAMQDRVERGIFREDYKAEFPVGQVSQQTIASLLDNQFPRLFLVRDGRIVKVWDGEPPSPDEVAAATAAP